MLYHQGFTLLLKVNRHLHAYISLPAAHPALSSSLRIFSVCDLILINSSEEDAMHSCRRNRWRAANVQLFGKWGLRK